MTEGNRRPETTATPSAPLSRAPVPVASTGRERALECAVGRARLAIPASAVLKVIDFDVSPPPPLSRKWVGGLSLVDGQVAVSVALLPIPAGTAARHATGVLLSVPDQECAWILEVGRVVGFGQFELLSRTKPLEGRDELPGWMRPAKASDGRSVAWVDVEAMMRELVGAA